MKNQYYKVIDEKGQLFIPSELRKLASLQDNSVVRLCAHENMIIMEKVVITDVDMVSKLKANIGKKEMSDDVMECFILAALSKMEKQKRTDIMAQLALILEK